MVGGCWCSKEGERRKKMRLFTFQDGKVKNYMTVKNRKIELGPGRYIVLPYHYFPVYTKRVSKGFLTFAWDENRWYLLPDSGVFDSYTAVVLAKAREVRYLSGVEILYSSLGSKKVFLLEFEVNGSAVIDDWYVRWNGKELNVFDVDEIEWLKGYIK
jgi:hypothetical protein